MCDVISRRGMTQPSKFAEVQSSTAGVEASRQEEDREISLYLL